MELAVLAAGIDPGRQFGEQPFVVTSPGEGWVEQLRIDADERRLEACVEELARESGRIASPEREKAVLTRSGETCFAVGADVLEEQIAEGDVSTPVRGAAANASALRAS